jgi:hypothetical protein
MMPAAAVASSSTFCAIRYDFGAGGRLGGAALALQFRAGRIARL